MQGWKGLQGGFAGTETKGQLDLTAYLSTIAPVDVVSRGCLEMFKYDATAVLPKIEVPVLIICGDKDILTKPIASEFMANTIPNSKLLILSQSAHMGVLERHESMVEAIHNFVTPLNGISNPF